MLLCAAVPAKVEKAVNATTEVKVAKVTDVKVVKPAAGPTTVGKRGLLLLLLVQPLFCCRNNPAMA